MTRTAYQGSPDRTEHGAGCVCEGCMERARTAIATRAAEHGIDGLLAACPFPESQAELVARLELARRLGVRDRQAAAHAGVPLPQSFDELRSQLQAAYLGARTDHQRRRRLGRRT